MILTEENYFSPEAEQKYMGSTQYKRFAECEAQAVAILNGDYVPEKSTALWEGSYLDAYFSGAMDGFRAKKPPIFKKDGSLYSEFQHADYVISRIERDELFLQTISGQAQVIMTGEIEGVPVKIKIDSLLPDRTVDLKYMRDMSDARVAGEGYVPFWRAWRYDIQAAIYQEIRRQNEGKKLPFGLAVATKEKPEPDFALLEFPQAVLGAALEEVKANIVYYDTVKRGLIAPVRCEKCDYCKSTKKLKGWVSIC